MGGLYGFYRGEVTEVNIDDNDYGAVRVFVPDLMCYEKDPSYNPSKMGLITLPGNNPVGGRNLSNDGSYGWGTVMVPRVGDWIWVFFEAGDPSKPFYFAALNIKNTKLPPENRDVTDPSTVYTLLKTYDGRSIIMADSSDVQRIELTGKYQDGAAIDADGGDVDPYTIDQNQTTILFDERSDQEKILIRTHKGDFLHIDVDEQKLQAYFLNDITIKTDGNLHLQVAQDVHFAVGGNMYTEIGKEKHTTVNGNFYGQVYEDKHERILGSSHEVVEVDKHIHITGDINLESGGGYNITVGSYLAIDVSSKVGIKSGAEISLDSGADFGLTVGGNLSEDVSGTGSIKIGTNLAIESVKFDAKASGMMSLEAGAAYNLLASGLITTHGSARADQAGAPPSSGVIIPPSTPTSPTSPTDAEIATVPEPVDPEGDRDT